MEVGAVVGAVPFKNIKREKPKANDRVILLGGKTGRDGCGGATGSSKEHDEKSINTCYAEVQKGNAPEERKIQRLFRNPEVTKLIKKCNDFGAGGVSVAIGELSDGVIIDLDKVHVKYDGLNGTELAISESQERMAIVVDEKDVEEIVKLIEEENIQCREVGIVTEEKRLVMKWQGDEIVNISREFLDTNGVRRNINIKVVSEDKNNPFKKVDVKGEGLEEKILNKMGELNIASQKGLVEKFDSTIGGGTVLMPFGGKYQLTPTEVSIHKIPLLEGETDTSSAITWGYNPKITTWSPYHGGAYAVIESMCKLVSTGCDYKNIRLSFQEYFEKLGEDGEKWGKPFSALLGTQEVMDYFEIPAIGGKDSMSGSFKELNVPPTLISFGVTKVLASKVITPELKERGNNIYLIKHNAKENFMPNLEQLKNNFELIKKGIENNEIISAMTVREGGVIESICKMSFGNKVGVKINIEEEELFKMGYGSFVVETKKELQSEECILIGRTIEEEKIIVNNTIIKIDDLLNSWRKTLEEVFPENIEKLEANKKLEGSKKKISYKKVKEKVNNPRVFIPIFPGTNCEYDSMKKFKEEGGEPFTKVFKNLTMKHIEKSIKDMAKNIDNCEILMLAGGFSAGDEPEGSAKFITVILKNEEIKEAIERLLKRDGLILGICNGFQALVKSGLLPNGIIGDVEKDSPTLTYNSINRHISKMVTTRVVNNNSPWYKNMEIGEEHQVPISHGEGKFVIKMII